MRDLERKVSVVLKLPRTDWSLPLSLVWILAIVLGVSFPSAAEAQFQRGTPRNQPNQPEEEEEEEEDPLANLTGLLDPSQAKPLMTVAEEKNFRARKEPNYMRNALKSLSPNNQTREQIEEGVRFRVLRLTMPENWPNIGNRTKELVNDLDVFADGAPRAREIAAEAAVKELGALLDSDQPPFVKINAASLLGRLNIESINRRTRTPAVPYAPAAEPLVKVLGDSQAGLDIKVAAVRGLERIMEDGDPSRQLRDKISKALVEQVNNIENYTKGPPRDWYHRSLVQALGAVEFPRSMTQQPLVVDALWKTMHDESLSWSIRTRAVRSLGQLDLDASFNIPLLMHEVVLLAGKMTAEYNANPKQSHWRGSFSDLYFAFRAHEERQQQKGWGFLINPPNAARDVIEGAYQIVLPLVNGVLKNETPEPIPNNSLAKLLGEASKWMKANAPSDRKIHQQAQPLAENKPPAAADQPATPTNSPAAEESAEPDPSTIGP